MDWFENDELFFDELARGHQWAEFVAERLRRAGFETEVTPMRKRQSIEHRHEFAREIDLLVGPRKAPFEVKSRDLSFGEDVASYPYRTAFVDTVSGWDAKDPRPVAVVLVSQRTRAMLVVPPSTAPEWERESKRDRVRGIDDEWYTISRSRLLTFDELAERMRRRWAPALA